jgi:hypothetical protein
MPCRRKAGCLNQSYPFFQGVSVTNVLTVLGYFSKLGYIIKQKEVISRLKVNKIG